MPLNFTVELAAEQLLTLSEGYYRGEAKNGPPHGTGILSYANQQEYEGQFVDGLPHGAGIYRWLPEGEEASGRFDGGEVVGKFSVVWADNGSYVGSIRLRPPSDEGLLPHGRGRRIYTSGSEYDGLWRLGQRHGEGVLVTTQGERYEGEWYVDLRHGQGTYSWSNGNSYDGAWNNDQPDGQGLFHLGER